LRRGELKTVNEILMKYAACVGLENPGEVFHAADRPYGLIQCAVQRDDAADPGPAWDSAASFA